MFLRMILGLALTIGSGFVYSQQSIELFNGKDLSNWEIINGGQFSVKQGLLTVNKGTGWLRSQHGYSDFILDIKFRFVEPGANSGIFVRTQRTSNNDENGWPNNGYQIQTMDALDGRAPLATMIPYGAPDFIHLSNPDALKKAYVPAGQWHQYQIIAKGETLQVKLNGELVTLAADIKHSSGHIGIQAEHGILEFASIVVTPL
ncbi:DUF1080 domain-containing protein [Paraferrimonas sp. SM1919]|uniref:3-keto-disaccharide hydrolase n=1 Tax=Paraferrimonas sp. SM1919 TaxID=2662263 RepID=UPI0013D5ACEC|nr:DUF1080 domain-containing protein [Paraferrimonas sp. SM1919]